MENFTFIFQNILLFFKLLPLCTNIDKIFPCDMPNTVQQNVVNCYQQWIHFLGMLGKHSYIQWIIIILLTGDCWLPTNCHSLFSVPGIQW